MLKAERLEIAKVVRGRARVAQHDADRHAARLTADFEAQLAAMYPINHPAWAEITKRAAKRVAEVDMEIQQICRERGIPENFRPSIHVTWSDRGENGLKWRRAELRKVAQTKIAALIKAAKAEIQSRAQALQEQLVAGMLESDDAKSFLNSMPTVEALMPPLVFKELEETANDKYRLLHY